MIQISDLRFPLPDGHIDHLPSHRIEAGNLDESALPFKFYPPVGQNGSNLGPPRQRNQPTNRPASASNSCDVAADRVHQEPSDRGAGKANRVVLKKVAT